jgi:tetratricopeptide (TPR) repeat protein
METGPTSRRLRVARRVLAPLASQTGAAWPGADQPVERVAEYLGELFRPLGGQQSIDVDQGEVTVDWTPAVNVRDPLERILALLQKGMLTEGIVLLELFRSDRPRDPIILYNLGLAWSDCGQPARAEELLRSLQVETPGHVNGLVALGVALQRQGRSSEAAATLSEAVRLQPTNPWAHRNLGACLLALGRPEEAVRSLREAVRISPSDAVAWCGLGQALEANAQDAEASEAFLRSLDLNEYGPSAEVAREGRTRVAHRTFRRRGGAGQRPDAVMYCLDALEQLSTMPDDQVLRISQEIAILGTRGLDVNDPERRYQLRNLGGSFSGLQLVCLMFAGFHRVAPGTDIGFDLSAEYTEAERLFGSAGGP